MHFGISKFLPHELFLCTDSSRSSRKPMSSVDENISVVKMPPKMRKRGRPKGAGQTVIGLPKKKGKSVTTRPKPFVLKSEWEKTRGMAKASCTYLSLLMSSLSRLYSHAQLVCRWRSCWTCNTWWGPYRRIWSRVSPWKDTTKMLRWEHMHWPNEEVLLVRRLELSWRYDWHIAKFR